MEKEEKSEDIIIILKKLKEKEEFKNINYIITEYEINGTNIGHEMVI